MQLSEENLLAGAAKRHSRLTIDIRWMFLRPTHLLLVMLLVSFGLRLLLVSTGGQLHFPDEYRYRVPAQIADEVYSGDVIHAFGSLLEYRTHPGHAAATLIPALIHRLAYELSENNEKSWQEYWQDPAGDFRFSAIFFAIPSVLSIGLIFLIAQRSGAESFEALLAAFLLASSNTWFVFSRHFLTYDFSMLLALSALYIALRQNEIRIREAIWTGILLFCAFWVYTNHSFLVCTIALLFCVQRSRSPRDVIASFAYLAVGGAILLIPILIYNYGFLDIDVFAGMQSQVRGITHGLYEEGSLLPFLYFRHIEGVVALFWLTGVLMAVKKVISQRPNRRHRVMLWLTAMIVLYLLMVSLSSGLHIIVLFGRTVRTLVPFIVLICAYSFAPYLERYGRGLTILFFAGVSIFALLNFTVSFRQEFIREVARHVQDEYGQVSYTTTFVAPSRAHRFANPVVEGARYQLVNAGYYYPITEMTRPPGRRSYPGSFASLQLQTLSI